MMFPPLVLAAEGLPRVVPQEMFENEVSASVSGRRVVGQSGPTGDVEK